MAKCKKHRPHIWRKLFLTLAVNLILRKLLKIFFENAVFVLWRILYFQYWLQGTLKNIYLKYLIQKKCNQKWWQTFSLFKIYWSQKWWKNVGSSSSFSSVLVKKFNEFHANFTHLNKMSTLLFIDHLAVLSLYYYKENKKKFEKVFLEILDPWSLKRFPDTLLLKEKWINIFGKYSRTTL